MALVGTCQPIRCVEQGNLTLFGGIEMSYDRVNRKVFRNPSTQAIKLRCGTVAKMFAYYDGSIVAPSALSRPRGSR